MHIGVFCALALVYLALPAAWRGWALFLVSAVTIYWLQPTLNIRWLDHSLPTLTLVIVCLCWALTRDRARPLTHDDALATAALIGVALTLTLPRYVELPITITSRPPPLETVGLGIVLALIAGVVLTRIKVSTRLTVAVVLIIAVFVVIKTEPFAVWTAGQLRASAGQDASLGSVVDLGWLGFSYVAFRLIHTLRDRQMGILPALSLREYLTYVIFFSAYTAGPIDRAETFTESVRQLPALHAADPNRLMQGAARIAVGLVKKFVVADSLAVFSLSAITADQAQSAGAMWVLLYAYAFRLFFDFSGYTDIAIGIGLLFGIKLPENFNRPYAATSITGFWGRWHMSLSAWARTYIYTPLSRGLLRGKRLSPDMVALVCSAATMSVIGLWHGVTVMFLIWGLWHGVGLFAHKLWSDRTRKAYRRLQNNATQARIWSFCGTLITFHFVLLGWVWFALPDVDSALRTFIRLFGGAS